ncbi:peptidoglycan editing factor PgeF [Pseudoalteromonas fenneropenaei]|uniref:Purine nucleoside phosphorylase n=1 Tax=Pseudoalteromonas fenneropenaei TaxID=1737459 RepID=A0ABV7CN59_9GAMM
MLIAANWPIQAQVGALSSTRLLRGYSLPPYDSFNVAEHVGDEPQHVAANRHLLAQYLPNPPVWLEQVHGSDVIAVSSASQRQQVEQADALYTQLRGQPLAIMTADCLPILLCSADGAEVAAIHGGWRPLAGGIVAKTVAHFSAPSSQIYAWLGPAIGPDAFEVGAEVKAAFCALDPNMDGAFKKHPEQENKYFADIFLLAQLQLQTAGVSAIYSDELCTVSNPSQFYSYRREGRTGRMVTLIWRK